VDRREMRDRKITRASQLVIFAKCNWNDQVKEDEMSMAYNMNWEGKECL
jgi:hypothetical protein